MGLSLGSLNNNNKKKYGILKGKRKKLRGKSWKKKVKDKSEEWEAEAENISIMVIWFHLVNTTTISLFSKLHNNTGVYIFIDFESLPMPDLKKLPKFLTAKSTFFWQPDPYFLSFFLPFRLFSPLLSSSFSSFLSSHFEKLPNLVLMGEYETLFNPVKQHQPFLFIYLFGFLTGEERVNQSSMAELTHFPRSCLERCE